MKNITFSLFFLICYTLIGQIGIGTKTPNKNAVLEVNSTEKGFLLPRITTEARNSITNIPAGLMIFNTTTNCMETYLGANGWASICGSVAFIPPGTVPVVSNVRISGTLRVAQIITGNFTYSDAEGDLAGNHIYRWYRADNSLGTLNKVLISGANQQAYTLTSNDLGKYIIFEITPVSTVAPTTGTSVSYVTNQTIINPVPPVASNVTISGRLGVADILTGHFTYSDADGDLAGNHIYRWYRADNASGTLNKVLINGANQQFYTLTSNDLGKYIIFEITPVSTVAPTTGTSVSYITNQAITNPIAPPTNTTAPTSWVGHFQTINQRTYRIANEDVVIGLSYGGNYTLNATSFYLSNVQCFQAGFTGAENYIHMGYNGSTYGTSSMTLTFSKPVTNIKFFIGASQNGEQFTFTTDGGTNGLSITPFGGNCNYDWSVTGNRLSNISATLSGTMLNIGGIYFKTLTINHNGIGGGSMLVMNYITGSSALPN